MLNNADPRQFKKIYLALGYTDLRKGIQGLSMIIEQQFHLNPYDPDILFMFCGRRADQIKCLVWERLSVVDKAVERRKSLPMAA